MKLSDLLFESQHLHWQWELAGPRVNLLLDRLQVLDVLVNLSLEVLQSVGLLRQRVLNVVGDLDGLVNVVNNLDEVLLTQTSGCHGWGTDTHTTWNESGLVAWDRVLVQGDVDLFAHVLNTSTVDALFSQRNKDHVGVGTVGNQSVAQLLELRLQSFSVLQDLVLVLLKLWGSSLLQSGSQSRDGVVVWTTLVTWEDGEVYWVL